MRGSALLLSGELWDRRRSACESWRTRQGERHQTGWHRADAHPKRDLDSKGVAEWFRREGEAREAARYTFL